MGALIRREVEADPAALAAIKEGAAIVIGARVRFFEALVTDLHQGKRQEALSVNG
jgi:hypothetical protein